VLVWNYHDDDLPAPATEVALTIEGVPAARPTLHHYRVDRDHSNAYEAWKKMGSPQPPTAAQHEQLAKAGELQLLAAPSRIEGRGGRVTVGFQLPRQGVSLVVLSW
jgi:xylan 1,4-beta-xylosidase